MSDALKAMVKRLEENIGAILASKGTPTVKLCGIGSHTVRLRNGEFRHKNFLGNEEFTFAGAYAGKKGDAILLFSPKVPADYAKMEITATKAMTDLIGWNDIIETAIAMSDDKIVLDERELLKKESVQREEELLDNPIYGSW